MIVLGVVVVLVLGATAFALLNPPSPEVGNRGKLEVAFTAEERQKIDTVSVTPAELAAARCEDGQRCWLAVDGVVYDMSVFPKWARGRHHGVEAGTDATEKFVKSGHARAYLEKMPVVGRLGS
ncbi:hypothetical protein GCM10027418_30440 [Mariniluteicoccus endophyticus]